jgi:predicted  nucleic acid-binding Zn-ribbon protein
MHPSLVLISNLWQCDASIDRLKAEFDSLVGSLNRATAELAELDKKLEALHTRITASTKEEREKNRESEELQERRKNTQRMIDTGTTPNYAASERQLAQIAGLLDTLDTRLLELMDIQEAAAKEKKELEKERDKVAATREQLAAARAQREAPLRAEMAVQLAKREVAAKEFPREWNGHYEELRRKRRPALVNVVEGICSSCSMLVTPQRVVETMMGRAVHVCPGCQGFLLP